MEQQMHVGYGAIPASEDWPSDERTIDVYCWRMEQLLGAGYSHVVADCLAENKIVDLHAACDLLARGCEQSTALRILS